MFRGAQKATLGVGNLRSVGQASLFGPADTTFSWHDFWKPFPTKIKEKSNTHQERNYYSWQNEMKMKLPFITV